MIKKIVSGGQNGADLAGLDVAKALRIKTGGWMSRGFETEDGPRPDYAQTYGLRDLSSVRYPARTRRNVQDAHATLIFSAFATLQGGTLLTYGICQEERKPVLVFYLPTTEWNLRLQMEVFDFLEGYSVINVAGSRESQAPGTYQATYRMLHAFLTHLRKWPA